jgi:CheY-like chemotaxis protein
MAQTPRVLRVLAVEDDESLASFYETWLTDEGHDVAVARDGADALRKLEWRPDVILLDLMLPVMDGYEFLRRLRADPRGRGIPVLVLSAALPPGRDAVRGAQAVVRKPFNFDRLLTLIDQHARRPRQMLH